MGIFDFFKTSESNKCKVCGDIIQSEFEICYSCEEKEKKKQKRLSKKPIKLTVEKVIADSVLEFEDGVFKKWFIKSSMTKGGFLEKGDVVKNPLTNERFELNNVELTVFYLIKENIKTLMESSDLLNKYIPLAPLKDSREKILKGIELFKKTNIKVYNGLFEKKCEITGMVFPITEFEINSKTLDKFNTYTQRCEGLLKGGVSKEDVKSMFRNLGFSVDAENNDNEINDNSIEEETGSTPLKSEGNWIEDDKLKVWERKLHITRPDSLRVNADDISKVDGNKGFYKGKLFTGIGFTLNEEGNVVAVTLRSNKIKI